jgi:hypothetical protein
MKIEDQIKRTVEEHVAGRPSYDGAFARVQHRYQHQRRLRIAAAAAGAVAAIVAAAIVVPQLGTNSATKVPFTTAPPTAQQTAATPSPSQSPPAAPPAVSCVPNCRLVQQKNFPSPIANASGVAFDGERLWVIGGGDGATHTLVEVDPANGSTGRRYTFSGLTETAGTAVYGMAWDGELLWISVSGNTNKIVRVDTADGSIVRSHSSPTELGPSDLDFDGKDVWLSSGTGEVFVLDRVSGGVKRSFRTWPEHGRDGGIAVRADEVWVGNLFGDTSNGGVAIQDPENGALIDTVVGDDGRKIRKAWGSMTFVGNQLVLLDRFGLTFYDVG